MKILYAATPEIAVPVLETLSENYQVCAVLTNPDTVSGRGRKEKVGPVKAKALELGIPVFQPDSLNSETRQKIMELNPDILICFAYKKIFGPKFLSLFKYPGLNIHPSLLPKYRGPSPINAAILNMDVKTGICVQTLVLKMDAGNIIEREEFPLAGNETAESLGSIAAEKSRDLIIKAINKIENGYEGTAQEEAKATYTSIIDKNDGVIDWNKTAEELEAQIRAYTPWPKSFTFFDGKRLTILASKVYAKKGLQDKPGKVSGIDKNEGILIQTGKGTLSVQTLQLEGKKALDWKSFLNGAKNFAESCLGEIIGENL